MAFGFVIAQAALPRTLQGRTEPMSADAVDSFALSRFTLTPSPSPVTRERGTQRRALGHRTAINGLLDQLSVRFSTAYARDCVGRLRALAMTERAESVYGYGVR